MMSPSATPSAAAVAAFLLLSAAADGFAIPCRPPISGATQRRFRGDGTSHGSLHGRPRAAPVNEERREEDPRGPSPSHSPPSDGNPPARASMPPPLSRREALRSALAASVPSFATSFCAGAAPTSADPETLPLTRSPPHLGYRYTSEWTGTSLPLLTAPEASALARRSGGSEGGTLLMGRWPDPILRRPASEVPPSLFGTVALMEVAEALRATARAEGAVGLAAQQCGVDVRMVWLDDAVAAATAEGRVRGRGWAGWLVGRRNGAEEDGNGGNAVLGEGGSIPKGSLHDNDGIFLLNPRIVARSSEVDMRVWTERCLVLPPTFSASVLRDSSVTVEYETLSGKTRRRTLDGELGRACQHEMDHDRGVLITDHVGMEELESDEMRRIESEGHEERMYRAYTRTVIEPSVVRGSMRTSALSWERRFGLIPPVNAAETPAPSDAGTSALASELCDNECLARRKRLIEERRAMMRQSRLSTSRQDVFDLSRQRAALYNTTYQGTSCPPGFPCL